MQKAWLAEKERLVRKHRIHQYFLWNDYQKYHQNFFLGWLRESDVSKNARILDACCGVGSLAFRLREMGYQNYYGIDRNRGNIEVGRELLAKFGLNARHLWVERAEKTHFQDGFFDVVCVLDASPYKAFNMGEAVKEVHRVLRLGGYLLLDVACRPMEFYDRVLSEDDVRRYLSEFAEVEFKEMSIRRKFGVIARK